jgi:hypothetical protein
MGEKRNTSTGNASFSVKDERDNESVSNQLAVYRGSHSLLKKPNNSRLCYFERQSIAGTILKYSLLGSEANSIFKRENLGTI